MARSIVTIDDLTNEEIEAVFEAADAFLDEMATPGKPHRIQGRKDLANDFILATLFYEPSTRTRLSFESAMHRLGGRVISSAEARSSSTAKGETIADTVRVAENYADIMVVRHPWEGAARVAAEYADIPVINAGDGSHEHPTQTLCDLYTLRVGQKDKRPREALKDLTVVLCGDLYHGRTVHSLAFALARFGARIVPLPASPECGFPEHVRRRLARDYHCFPLRKDDLPESLPTDVLYITPEEPHQLSLWQPEALDLSMTLLSKKEQRAIRDIKGVDAFYATRLQVERQDGGDQEGTEGRTEYPIIDAEFLKKKPFQHSRVMHPLPRVDELAYELDQDTRGVYFQQASYGVPVRMALIAGLLELQSLFSSAPQTGHLQEGYPVYHRPGTIRCNNPQCVTSQQSEQRYLTCKFWIVGEKRPTLRCVYCDHEQEPQVIADSDSKQYQTETSGWSSIPSGELVLFLNEVDAQAAGYEPQAPAASGV